MSYYEVAETAVTPSLLSNRIIFLPVCVRIYDRALLLVFQGLQGSPVRHFVKSNCEIENEVER
jgi:hypothetical protein